MDNFVRLEDKLKLGHTIIKVQPKMGKFDKNLGTFVEKDKQSGGTTARGNQFWVYTTDVPTGKKSDKGRDIMCTITAFNPEEKALLDSGKVSVNLVEVYLTPQGKWLSLEKLTQLGLKPQRFVNDETGEIAETKKKRYYINKIADDIPGVETVPEYNNPAYE